MIDVKVKSAARAFEIVEAFGRERRRMTAAQLGPLLDYPRSSLNVLLKSLTTQGYLSFATHDQTYFPTLQVTHLGDWVPSALFGSPTALQHLQTLCDTTRETVTVTMATGQNMRCLIALDGSFPIGLRVEEGTLFPMFGSGVGITYLSSLDDAALASLQRHRKGRASRMPLLTPDLLEAIATTRGRGYCTMYDAVLPDTGAISMPLESPLYGETLVVAVAGLSARVRSAEAMILVELRKCISHLIDVALQ